MFTGTHSSLAGDAQALATVTAIIDGTGSIGELLFVKLKLKKFFIIHGGSVNAPFTGTAYRVKYFKPIPKKKYQDTSTV